MALRTVLVLLFGLLATSLPAAPPSWSVDLAWPTIAPGAWTSLVGSVPAATAEWTLAVTAVSISGKESLPLEYRQAAGGAFELPVFVDDATRELKLSFVVGGVAVEQRRLALGDRLFPGHLIGVVGLSTADRAWLSELLLPQEPVRVMTLPPSLWPTSPLAYGGLSALVLADPGPLLSPAQLQAVRAWLASGGQLLVLGPTRGRSLVGQIGGVEGRGRVTLLPGPPEHWNRVLALRPYGQERLWGSDFGPAPRPQEGQPFPLSTATVVVLLVWAGLGSVVLAVQRRGGSGVPLTWAALGTVAVLVLGATGSLAWDGGLQIHGRELVLPAQQGRFVVLDVRQPTQRSGLLGWSETSPWALARWKVSFDIAAAVPRLLTETRAVYAAFLPPVAREAPYAVTWAGSARWMERRGDEWKPRETIPDALVAEAPWLERLAATAPGVRWEVGWDGAVCWTEPAWGGRP